jgi:hypothetical protein
MSDSFEVAEVWKSVRVTEEVVLRREVTERHETVRDTVRRDEVVVEQARRPLPAARAEAAAVRPEPKAVVPAPAVKPEPAQLAADLKKVAERFEDHGQSGNGQTKAPARPEQPETASVKADQKAAPQPSKAAAEQPKASARPETGTGQNDKGGHAHTKA